MQDTLIHTTQAYTPSWWVACPSWSCVRVSQPWSAPASWLPQQPPEPYSQHPEWERGRRRRKPSTESISKEEELVNRWLLAGELADMIEGSVDKHEKESRTTEGEVNGREERIKRESSVQDPHFLMLTGKPSLFSLLSIWCKIPSILLLYEAEKYAPYRQKTPPHQILTPRNLI